MSEKIAITLGKLVMDVTSGFRGLATQRIEQLNGNVRFAVQQFVNKENKIDGGYEIDDLVLVLTEPHPGEETERLALVPAPATPIDVSGVKLGELCYDSITGFEGIAIERSIYMNGCVWYALAPKHDPKKEQLINAAPKASWIAAGQVKKKNDGVNGTPNEPVQTGSGGPTTLAVRNR